MSVASRSQGGRGEQQLFVGYLECLKRGRYMSSTAATCIKVVVDKTLVDIPLYVQLETALLLFGILLFDCKSTNEQFQGQAKSSLKHTQTIVQRSHCGFKMFRRQDVKLGPPEMVRFHWLGVICM